MRKICGLAVGLLLLLPPSVHAQTFVRLIDNSATPTTAHPVNSTNPLPVTISGSGGGTVGVTSTVTPTGTSLANSTSAAVALSGSAQSQALTAASSNVTIAASSDSTGLYFAFTGPATTSDFFLPAGAGFTYTGVPAVSTIYFIGASAAGKASIFAH